MSSPFIILLLALIGGITPALLWLYFWLSEDKRCPEPRNLLILAFLSGMLSVFLVIPLEKLTGHLFTGTAVVIIWAGIEEVIKFIVAYIVVLRNKAMNEPIDAVIYMITIALGFAALENTLFLLSPLSDGLLVGSLVTGNLRFIGATLLHVLASSTVGVAVAFSFYRKGSVRMLYIFSGLILASGLHALYNFFILKSSGSDGLLIIFLGVWFGIITLILLFEKIKRLKDTRIFTK